MTDMIHWIDEQAISLIDSLFCQDPSDSSTDESNRTSVASSDVQQSRPTSPQTINHIHYNIIQNSILAAHSSNLTGLTANSGERNSGGEFDHFQAVQY